MAVSAAIKRSIIMTAAIGGAAAPPSQDLSFLTPDSLPSGITFTRSSIGTYFDSSGIMRTAAINTPRWGYHPSTYTINGLLTEEARTN